MESDIKYVHIADLLWKKLLLCCRFHHNIPGKLILLHVIDANMSICTVNNVLKNVFVLY
jgi:hypothetical protein